MSSEKSLRGNSEEGIVCTHERMYFVNGVEVVPAGVVHTLEFFDRNINAINGLVDKSNFVVLEGDVALGEHIDSGHYEFVEGFRIGFFSEMMELCWQKNKKVIQVDPYRGGFSLAEKLFTGGLILALFETGYSLHKGKPMNRRQFLTMLLAAGIAGVNFLSTGDALMTLQRQEAGDCDGGEGSDFIKSPLSEAAYRESGAVLGLDLAAGKEWISGTGVYFTGSAHVEGLVYLSRDIGNAREVYRRNWHGLYYEFGRRFDNIRLWQPDKRGGFNLVYTARLDGV